MIGKLRGRLDSRDDEALIVDAGGVGYEIFCSTRTFDALPAIGEMVELVIETHVREDHFHLYGFPDRIERDWFRLLMTVQGVGARMALAILGAFSPQQLAQSILAQDAAALRQISGVGPKLAARLATELKDKVLKMPTTGFMPDSPLSRATSGSSASGLSADAISALVNLGYNRTEAFSAINQAMQKAKDIARVDELIRLGLKELAR